MCIIFAAGTLATHFPYLKLLQIIKKGSEVVPANSQAGRREGRVGRKQPEA